MAGLPARFLPTQLWPMRAIHQFPQPFVILAGFAGKNNHERCVELCENTVPVGAKISQKRT